MEWVGFGVVGCVLCFLVLLIVAKAILGKTWHEGEDG